jgi:hypothetical protein
LPDSAVAVRHFDPPTLPAGDVVLLQIVDDLEGLSARRLIVGAKFGRRLVVKAVAVVDCESVEGHRPRITKPSRGFRRVTDIARTYSRKKPPGQKGTT